MREILFKAKIKNWKKIPKEKWWVEGLPMIKWGMLCIQDLNDENKYYIIDPDTLCQYTGLTDKNGKKIWENDICIIEDGTLDKEDGYFVCKWDDDTARYILDGYGLTVDFDNVNTWDVEVIGNIFDNAELLEE